MGSGVSGRSYLNYQSSRSKYLEGEGSNELQTEASKELAAERSKLLGVCLDYLLNDFVLEARQVTSIQDPNFYTIAVELASGENGKGKGIQCPRDQQEDCSIVDALDLQKMADRATHFLSWCWAYKLSTYAESWQLWLWENRKHGAGSGNVFVWQCLFCNNQYRIEENTNAINDSLGAIFRTRLLNIRKMVVLLDQFKEPVYLTRVWCVYEMYTALTSSEVSIDFMLPPQQASAIQTMIRDHGTKEIEQSFERVNSESATAARQEDADKVKCEIRQSTGGFAAVDEKVVEKMKDWVKKQFVLSMDATSPSNKPANAAAFLRKSGLDETVVQKLMQAGIKTYQDLLFVKDELQDIGLTQSEEHAVREVLQRGSSTTGRNWKAELQELGLPYSCYAHLTEEEVLREGSMESLNYVQKKRFHDWRRTFVQQRLEGQNVTEENVGLGLAVERGPDWRYDTGDSDKTPEDGGSEAYGLIVGWRTHLGHPYGPEASIPNHGGWVRVQWPVTGFQKSYRLGSVGSRGFHDLRFASAAKIQASSFESLENVSKGMLKLHHLRCDFGYCGGTKHSHYAKFDIRKEACLKVAGFVHGDVVEDVERSSKRSTCIGLKYNAEKKKVEMWFHVQGSEGAGIFAGADLDSRFRTVDHETVREVSREDVEGASDGEIEHDDRDWVCRNLEPTVQYQSKSGHTLNVDTRAEILSKFKMPYKSGDVIRDKADGELMTCIGVAFRPGDGDDREYRKAEVWFHVEKSNGAGINPKIYKNLGRFEVVRNEPVGQVPEVKQPKALSSGQSVKDKLAKLKGKLKCDFSFPSGTHRADDELFDVRENVLQKVTGWKPGTVLTMGGSHARLTLIGLRPDPISDDPKVWWHFQDEDETHPGAGMLQEWETMRLQDTGERVDLITFRNFLKTLETKDSRSARGARFGGLEALMSQLEGGGGLEEAFREALRREL